MFCRPEDFSLRECCRGWLLGKSSGYYLPSLVHTVSFPYALWLYDASKSPQMWHHLNLDFSAHKRICSQKYAKTINRVLWINCFISVKFLSLFLLLSYFQSSWLLLMFYHNQITVLIYNILTSSYTFSILFYSKLSVLSICSSIQSDNFYLFLQCS